MKKILTLLFSILISFNSYGEWKYLHDDVNGNSNYIDMDRIREHGGYVYYWTLIDYLKPTKHGHMSSKMYVQGDCGVHRIKYLSYTHSKQPMGEGGETNNPPNPKWVYPGPDSIGELMLKTVCVLVGTVLSNNRGQKHVRSILFRNCGIELLVTL